MDEFVWRSYEDRLAELLNGRDPAALTAEDILGMSPALHVGWGLAPLGLFPLMRTRNLVSQPTFPWPAQSRWVTPATHSLTEEGPLENSSREQDNFVAHIFAPDRARPFEARLSLAVIRKDIQRRGTGRFSPLYDPSTGQTLNLPTAFTHSGEVLWSKDVTTDGEFYAAARQLRDWLSRREACDVFASMTPRFPRQDG